MFFKLDFSFDIETISYPKFFNSCIKVFQPIWLFHSFIPYDDANSEIQIYFFSIGRSSDATLKFGLISFHSKPKKFDPIFCNGINDGCSG